MALTPGVSPRCQATSACQFILSVCGQTHPSERSFQNNHNNNHSTTIPQSHERTTRTTLHETETQRARERKKTEKEKEREEKMKEERQVTFHLGLLIRKFIALKNKNNLLITYNIGLFRPRIFVVRSCVSFFDH